MTIQGIVNDMYNIYAKQLRAVDLEQAHHSVTFQLTTWPSKLSYRDVDNLDVQAKL